MIKLLQSIYSFDNKQIRIELEKMWSRYQMILKNKKASWQDANEARAILYTIGRIYPEHIALGSLERRIGFIKPKISLDDFLLAIDGKSVKVLDKYKKNKEFLKLKEFYEIVKEYKNKVNVGALYLDEDIFNKLYQKKKPKNYW